MCCHLLVRVSRVWYRQMRNMSAHYRCHIVTQLEALRHPRITVNERGMMGGCQVVVLQLLVSETIIRTFAAVEGPCDALCQSSPLLHKQQKWPSWSLTVIGVYCWCHSIRHIQFPISILLQLRLYLASFPRYQLFPKRKRDHVTLNTSLSGVCVH